VDISFQAGHPGLDFINTTFLKLPERSSVERIGDGAAFLAWFVEAGLLDRASALALKRHFGNETLDGVAADARKLREWARDWIVRWHVAPHADYGGEVRRINRALERASWYHQLVFEKGRFDLAQRCRFESTDDLLALLLLQIALLVTREEPELVKRCAGADCVLWFVDRTKAHRRLFCSAAVCGNRAKVAAFRARQRGT
jgi:predicted RNA-binding Zn ribbon-like protein